MWQPSSDTPASAESCVPRSRRREAARDAIRPDAHGGPLPAAVPLLAGLGLALLCVCTLPAVHAQRRLERDHARAARETREAEARVERLRRELGSGAQQRYLRIKAASTLLHRGAGYIEARDARLRRPEGARTPKTP